jgi:hypothetical protein
MSGASGGPAPFHHENNGLASRAAVVRQNLPGSGCRGDAKKTKVFWFFFSKKNNLAYCVRAGRKFSAGCIRPVGWRR